MKYIARPVEVEAFKILEIFDVSDQAGPFQAYRLDDERVYRPKPEMLSRIAPVVGDFLVVQSDGYEYLNPKAVFERKYRPVNS